MHGDHADRSGQTGAAHSIIGVVLQVPEDKSQWWRFSSQYIDCWYAWLCDPSRSICCQRYLKNWHPLSDMLLMWLQLVRCTLLYIAYIYHFSCLAIIPLCHYINRSSWKYCVSLQCYDCSVHAVANADSLFFSSMQKYETVLALYIVWAEGLCDGQCRMPFEESKKMAWVNEIVCEQS